MKYVCPACEALVDEADLVVTETPEDFEELLVADPPELPEKYRGHVRCYGRLVHIQTDCARCHGQHVD